jgi:hypothetical protein
MAILFTDGSSENIDAGSPASLDNIEQKTVTCWTFVNGYGGGGQGYICSKIPTGGGSPGWFIQLRSSQGPAPRENFHYHHWWSGGEGIWKSPDGSIQIGELYFLAATYDRGSASNDAVLYINGESVTVTETNTPSGTVTDDSGQTFLTANLGDGFRNVDGPLGDLRVYNRILTPAEIQTIYQARGVDGIVAGLLSRWPMDEGPDGGVASGTDTVKDVGGSENDGTPTNSPDYDDGIIRSRRRVA